MPLIQLSQVDVIKDANLILKDVCLTMDKGDFAYLVGRVGSGKTSLIKTLIGEYPVKQGTAQVAGYDLVKLKRRQIPYLRRRLGVVFQDFQLLQDRSVYENLHFVLRATEWTDEKRMQTRIEEVLERVGMAHKQHKLPHQLSGGEQQRVAIARAILNNPEIILADEPTGNLDHDTQQEIMELFMDIHHTKKPAMLMVTHNMSLLQRFPATIYRCAACTFAKVEEPQEIEFSKFMD